ncbi:hypothetical protein EHP00_1340 [Ecytonucleospora hepatopenaei]|uniref:Uncharacterized protein n=1 Tax=Ecytonucleospora hepatopenaei TaxID=646526 RepID=A0A1W0E6T6_9MICR|nr:hypothetical protein EHP00_1340 [Ecytonucleospora hepatopenaei]
MKKFLNVPGQRAFNKLNTNSQAYNKLDGLNIKKDENGMDDIDEFWKHGSELFKKSEDEQKAFTTEEYYKLTNLNNLKDKENLSSSQSNNENEMQNDLNTVSKIRPPKEESFSYSEINADLTTTNFEKSESIEFDKAESFIEKEEGKITESGKRMEFSDFENNDIKPVSHEFNDTEIEHEDFEIVSTQKTATNGQVINFDEEVVQKVNDEVEFKHGSESYSNDKKQNLVVKIKEQHNSLLDDQLEQEIEGFQANFGYEISSESCLNKNDIQNEDKQDDGKQIEKSKSSQENSKEHKNNKKMSGLKLSPFKAVRKTKETPKNKRIKKKRIMSTSSHKIALRNNKSKLLEHDNFSDVLNNKYETPKKRIPFSNKTNKRVNVRQTIRYKKEEDNLLGNSANQTNVQDLKKETMPKNLQKRTVGVVYRSLPKNTFQTTNVYDGIEEAYLVLKNGAYTLPIKAGTKAEVICESGAVKMGVKKDNKKYAATTLYKNEKVNINKNEKYQISNLARSNSRIKMIFYE